MAEVNDRLKQEVEMLKQRYPLLQHDDLYTWVLVPKLKLPVGRFNKEETPVLFSIPVGYPSTGPDNFFIDNDLRLKDGSNAPAFNAGAQSSTGPARTPGNWGWFSWHPNSWTPNAEIEKGDNLITFMKGVNMCLRGEEAS